MPKVLLKRSYAKEDEKVKSLDLGEIAVITNPDNPGIAFKNSNKEVVFIGTNGNCACGPGGGSSGGGNTENLTDYQKKKLSSAINGMGTVESSLIDLDKRIKQLSTKPTYTKDEIQDMGQLKALAYKDKVDITDLTACVKKQLALAESSLQPGDLSGYQTINLSNSITGLTSTTVEGALAELAQNMSGSGSNCTCTTLQWDTVVDNNNGYSYNKTN